MRSMLEQMFTPPPRNGVKLTYNEQMSTFEKLGNQALNAADYERTMHYPIDGPVGRRRLACDEEGNFDKNAPRSRTHVVQEFPRHLHSKIVEGEFVVVNNLEEQNMHLQEGTYSLTPIERKARRRVTDQTVGDTLTQGLAFANARVRELEDQVTNMTKTAARGDVSEQLAEERKARIALEEKLDRILAAQAKPAVNDDEEDEEDAAVSTASKRRKK